MNNTVGLVNIFGDDTTIALAAWTSTGTELTQERKDRIPEFVKSLARDKHTVPFEHTLLTFRLNTDIATHIHVLKHRIGVSVSSQSFRWKEQKTDSGYIPSDWNDEWKSTLDKFQQESYRLYHACVNDLVANGMERKRAKESARFFLPYSAMLEYIVTFNFHSFAKFCILRNDPHAQMEVRAISRQMIELVQETHHFDAAIEGWGIGLKIAE